MKTLTIQQPWAAAIIHGAKDIENRTWLTRYRGTLAIHAGAGSFRIYDPDVWMIQYAPGAVGLIAPHRCTKGAIIGVVDLVDCVRDSSSPWASPDCYHWVLSNPRAIQPIPAMGRLGLWDVPQHALAELL